MFTKGQSGELSWVTSSNIPSPLKWFLGPFSDFASSLIGWTLFSLPLLMHAKSEGSANLVIVCIITFVF